MAIEFVPFEKALEELGTTAEELKKWIASGAIRAFSDGGTFKFRRPDLDKFKAARQTSPTLSLGDTGQNAPADAAVPDEIPELAVLDEGEPQAPAQGSAPTHATDELSLDDLSKVAGEGSGGTEEIVLPDLPQAEVISLEGDQQLLEDIGSDATQPIELEGEASGSSPAFGTVSMEVPEGIGAPADELIPGARAGGLEIKREGSPLWAAIVACTSAILVFAAIVVFGLAKERPVGYLSGFENFMK